LHFPQKQQKNRIFHPETSPQAAHFSKIKSTFFTKLPLLRKYLCIFSKKVAKFVIFGLIL